jgi:nicotinamidase-related amidase
MKLTERFTTQHGALLVVDVQEELLTRMKYRDLVVANTVRLIRGARHLGLPVWATEQDPEGLSPTVAEIAALVPQRLSKTTFHCCAIPLLFEQFYYRQIRHVTLAGIEAHVCIAQTALELLKLGIRVQVPTDAVASRSKMDWEFALRRLEHAGAIVSTTEAVLFEWTERSDRPEFKAISELIKSFVPPVNSGDDDRAGFSRPSGVQHNKDPLRGRTAPSLLDETRDTGLENGGVVVKTNAASLADGQPIQPVKVVAEGQPCEGAKP